jgi:hypothetical protein
MPLQKPFEGFDTQEFFAREETFFAKGGVLNKGGVSL